VFLNSKLNKNFKEKLLIRLIRLKRTSRLGEGFTLIELLVVIIIMGILTTVALPAFLRQIGKARETDAKINLGAIARSQQAYHFEKSTFANSNNVLTINGAFSSSYYNFSEPTIANDLIVKHEAITIDPSKNGTRNYAVGVYFNNGLYTTFLCQGKEIGDTVEAPDTDNGVCGNNGIQVR
jgi:type IV pilus assembly protein PilA